MKIKRFTGPDMRAVMREVREQFGPDAVITDALSTSVFVMGVDQGLKLISTLPDYEGIVIDAEGQMFYSDGLQSPE